MILLAGGTGHLGAKLVTILSGDGQRVRVISRNPDRARLRLGAGAEIVEGDVRDQRSLQAAVKGVDCVVSAVTGFGPRGAGPERIDFEGNANLIRAAASEAVRRFVLVSIHGASPEHPMELMRMKFAAEQALRSSVLEWVIIRPTIFKELWAEIVGRPIGRSGKAIVFGRGENPVNFASVDVVARSVARAVTDPTLSRQTVDVGGPDNVTLNDFAAALGARSVVHIPSGVLALACRVLHSVRPDLAGLIEAAIAMDTIDMTLNAGAGRA